MTALAAAGEMSHRSIIITGDDFGFSRGVNRAIIQAHARGLLTSASLMVTGEAFDDAVALAKAHPTLAVGLHLVVLCGRSAMPACEIPHLVDAAGQFSSRPVVAGLRYQFHRAARHELAREIRAQLTRFRRTGLPLSHVDGHLHLHMHPVVLNPLVELAPEFGIRAIRLPGEELTIALGLNRRHLVEKVVLAWIFGRLRAYGTRRLRAAGIAFPERVYGLLETGRVTEDYLLRLIPRIQAERVVIYAHPAAAEPGEAVNGPIGAGQQELAALLSERVRRALATHGFTLATYP